MLVVVHDEALIEIDRLRKPAFFRLRKIRSASFGESNVIPSAQNSSPSPPAFPSRELKLMFFRERAVSVIRWLTASVALAAAATVALAASEPKVGVRLTPSASLPSCAGLDLYRIETPIATYYLEKAGAGLAAMIDREGHDWIGFSSEPGSRAGGEFRGFPNAVNKEDGSYFHPKNEGTEPSTTTVEHASSERVTIAAVSGNSRWACRYDFFPTHCTFTMTKMSPGHKYWILYEGTPGGGYDDTDWWMTSAVKEPKPMSTNHEGDIPAPEWIVFGDVKLKRVLFLASHQDDDAPDRFYQMNRQMTVFGFGRLRGEKHLTSVPRSFSIGFLETTRHAEISAALLQIVAPK
jgi:hypothetical protein